METRDEILDWLETHPQSIAGDPAEIVARCERGVKRHAAADAWLNARDYMSRRRDLWEQRGGYPITSSAFVAREMCSIFAHELRRLHPMIAEGSESELAGEEVIRLLDHDAWAELRPWVRNLALAEEQKTWRQIVKFTRNRARHLPEQREGIDADWDTPDGTYAHAAAVIAGQLMEQYAAMAEAAEH